MSAATRRVVSQPTKSTYIGHSAKTIAGKPGEPLRKVKATEEMATARSSSCPAAQHPSTAIARPAVPQTALRADPVVPPLPVLLRPADEALLERWRWFVEWSLVQRRVGQWRRGSGGSVRRLRGRHRSRRAHG